MTLRQRRERLKLSRHGLAIRAQISPQAIEQFESGRKPKDSAALTALEATLDRLEKER